MDAADLAQSVRSGQLDLLTALTLRNQDHSFREIFKHLGGQSILSAKLTCKACHCKVHEWVCKTEAGKWNMLKRLEKNWRADRYSKLELNAAEYSTCCDIKLDGK